MNKQDDHTQHNAHRLGLLSALLVLGAASACAPADDEADKTVDQENTESAVEASADAEESDDEGLENKGFVQASTQSRAELFRWDANELDVQMRPVSSHVCFMSRVSGNLGGASMMMLHRASYDVQGVYRATGNLGGHTQTDSGTVWKLGGAQRESNSLTGEAICVPLNAFFSDPGSVIWQSGNAWANIERRPPGGCSGTSAANMWNGDAAGYLTGIQGDFDGGGEVVEVIDGPWNGPSKVQVKTGQCGVWNEADARSLFVGTPGQTSMWRYNYTRSGGQAAIPMIATNQGVCYLHRVSGDFNGAEERVRIFPQVNAQGREMWMLEAKKGGGSSNVTAQCITYDQRAGCAGPGVPCI